MTEVAPTDDCYRCGYDLHTIADDRPCPECGLLAERSRRVSDELRFTRPRWLKRMAWGIRLVLLAILIGVLWILLLNVIANGLFDSTIVVALPPFVHVAIGLFGGLNLAAILFWIGVFLLTGAEHYAPADRADRWRRVALRFFAIIPFVVVLLCSEVLARQYAGLQTGDVIARTTLYLTFVGCLPIPLLLFYQLRGLAKRARSANLAEHCAIVGIGVAGALVYTGAVVIVFQKAESWGWGSNWSNHGSASLVLAVMVGVAGFLFVLWSLTLLVRFSIAFFRVSKQLRGEWRRDDRSITALESP